MTDDIFIQNIYHVIFLYNYVVIHNKAISFSFNYYLTYYLNNIISVYIKFK